MQGGDVVYIDVTAKELAGETPLQIACKFYGLEIENIILDESKKDIKITESLEHKEFYTIVISAKSFSSLNRDDLFSILKNQLHKKMPLLILGVTSDIDSNILSEW